MNARPTRLSAVNLRGLSGKPFVPIGALAAQVFVPIQAVPRHAERGGAAVGEQFCHEGLQGLGALVHAAEVAVGAAGFGVECVCQLQNFGLQGEPVFRVANQHFVQPVLDIF